MSGSIFSHEVLDNQRRCNGCGGKLHDEFLEVCPTCGAQLADVGIYQELKDWGRIRKRGAVRHILLRGVLGFGMPLALAWVISRVLKHGADGWLSALTGVFTGLIAGLLFGIWHWRAAERQYISSCNKEHDHRPVV